MKKILTILAATATMFAFGAGNGDTIKPTVNHGADFQAEGFVPGANFIWGYNDSYTDATGDDRYWFTADTDAANIISNYPTSGTGVPIASRPDLFADNANSNYLQVETTGKLYRTVKGNGGSGDFTNSTDYAYSITNAAIYLDTLVKFTAADSVFGDDALESGDKIAIEYVEHESEGPGDDTVTNFVIRAGYFAQTVIPTNYFAAVPADFEKDAWHRLTVRTFASIDAANHVGFVVYLDGTPLEYEDTVLAGDNFTATGAAANFYKEGCHALYPSFVQGGDFQYSISAAAFSGNGSLDDVVFTTTTPNFITSGEAVRTEITLGTGIANVAVTVAGTPIAAESTSTSTLKIFNLPAGTTSFVLSVSANEAEGYTFDETTGITLTDATYNPADDTVTITGASPALTVIGKRDNFDVYVDGEKTRSYSTLSEALAGVADGATLKLAYNYAVSDFEASGFTTYAFAGKEIVLDLNGKVLNGGSSNDYYLFAPGEDGVLTVIDSGTGGKIVYGGTKGMFNANVGDVLIGSTTLSDNGATFDGVLMGAEGYVSRIYRGKFSYEENTEGGAFVANNSQQLAAGSTVTHVGDYWVVAPGGTPQPTQILVPTAATGLVYDGTEQTGVAAGTGYTLTGTYAATDAGDYTATATLASGYIWADGSSDPTNISWSIAAKTDATVVVALTADIAEYTAQLEFPTATATIGDAAVAGNTAWDPDTISEPEAGATNTYTVTFTVTTANYAGSTGTATFKVFKTAGGGKTYPSYITDATAQGKYDTWAENNNISASDFPDAGNAYEAAFLLNIAPDAADQTLKPTAITMEGGKVVISANQTLTSVNGKVYVKTATTLAGLATAEWAEATLSEGKVQVTPGNSDTAGFYKIKVDF